MLRVAAFVIGAACAGCGVLLGGDTVAGPNGEDASVVDDGPVDAGYEEAAWIPAFLGHVTVLGAAPNTTGLGAGFAGWGKSPPDAESVCNGLQVGSCCYGQTPILWTYDVQGVSAGDISMNVGFGTFATLSQEGGFYGGLLGGPYWKQGDTVSANAAGDTVHAFRGGVVVPRVPQGLTPPIEMKPTTISRSADWTLSWTPSGIESQFMEIFLGSDIGCVVPDAVGRVTVSSVLLGNASQSDNLVQVVRVAVAMTAADNAAVHIFARVEVKGDITLQ